MRIPTHIKKFWQSFEAAIGHDVSSRFYESFHFDDNEPDANALGDLVLQGRKRVHKNMQVNYQEYLPNKFRASAARLYFEALKEKLEPILGGNGRTHGVLAKNIANDRCITAFCGDKLVGMMGIQTGKRGFVNPSLRTMVRIYGVIGGIIRMGGLAVLHHPVGPDEVYVDGVAVASEMRGRGIGTHLFELLEQAVLKKEIKKISLEVIDTNPRAKALYQRLGFEVVKTQTVWPLNLLIKFPFRSATLMVKTMG